MLSRLVFSLVLYPYVYLAARAMFLMQGRAAADVARTLGAKPLTVFARVQIPMARPAMFSAPNAVSCVATWNVVMRPTSTDALATSLSAPTPSAWISRWTPALTIARGETMIQASQ